LTNPWLAKHSLKTEQLSIIIRKWVKKDVVPAIFAVPNYDPTWEEIALDQEIHKKLQAKPEAHVLPITTDDVILN
jgi:hypothetical protein